ncbi:hypothetical protein BU17DRAFT_81409 [Hysterangium stoloniferum]|nr:hypothetical protein BU17DRAFT_81409 [Hysterangium stoloniferum]
MAEQDNLAQPPEGIFTLNGEPIRIHLHSTLSKGARNAIAKKIVGTGGDPEADLDDARVIICRADHPSFKALEHKYDHDRYKWVEPPSWVDICISGNKYEHVPRDEAGRRTSYARIPFTEEDDQNIVNYLTLRIPFKETGGRSGFNVWKELCSDDRKELYPWASRHPWQAWRERYVKNQDIFDPRIAAAIKEDPDPPHPGGKGQYRIRYGKVTRPRVFHEVTPEDDNEEEEEEEEEGQGALPEKRKRVSDMEQADASKRRDTGKGRSRPQPAKKINQPDAQSHDYDMQDDNELGPSNWTDDPFQQIAASPEERAARAKVADSFTQATLVAPRSSGNQPSANTQKTLVPSSPPRTRRQTTQASLPSEQPRTRVTRAHNPPERNLQKQPPPGHTHTAKKTATNENRPLLAIPEVGSQSTTSAPEEVQVEVILKGPPIPAQSSLEGPPVKETSSSDSESDDDDDDTAQMLRKTSEIVQQGTRQRSRKPALTVAVSSTPRFRKPRADILGPSSTLNVRMDVDPDVTPKPGFRRGAKKTATTRYISSVEDEDVEGDDDSDQETDSQSGTGITTDSSVPVVSTNAHEYKLAHEPFTPAHGTKAEERVRSERTSRRKGKGRAM